MIQGVSELVNKTIQGVIVKEGVSPRTQVFLLFSDNTYYELYSGDRIEGTSQLSSGTTETVRRYMAPDQRIVVEAGAGQEHPTRRLAYAA